MSPLDKPTDRRRWAREDANVEAVVGPKSAGRDDCHDATVDDLSRYGARIRSCMSLKKGESLVLHIGMERRPFYGEVVWARREGLFVSRRTGKPGQGFVGGCTLQPISKPKPWIKAGKIADAVSHGVRVAVVMTGLALVALLLYAIISIFGMMHSPPRA